MVRLTNRAECTWDPQLNVRKVNQYLISSNEAGHGTYSTVVWAEDEQQQCFAVKVFARGVLERERVAHFDANGAGTESLNDRIARELAILGAVEHPNIVSLVEVIDDARHGSLYGVFEGLTGGQLMEWMPKVQAYAVKSDMSMVQRHWGADALCDQAMQTVSQGYEVVAFQEHMARYLFCQMLNGCQYLHSQWVVHKDLKPDNVLLTAPIPTADPRFVQRLNLQAWPKSVERRNPPMPSPPAAGATCTVEEMLQRHPVIAKIGDFNCAMVCEQEDCLIYDAEGTQLFAPPECFSDHSGGVNGKLRDAWSLGAILFCMFYGKCPYWAKEPLSMQLQILFSDLEMPQGSMPAGPEDLLLALLKKKPEERMTVGQALQSAWLREM